MYWRPVASSDPKSNTWTMFGCTSRAAASASRRKRETKFESVARCSASSLTATCRSQPRVERELDRGHATDPEPALEAIAVCEERVCGHPSPGGTPPVAGGSSSRPLGVDGDRRLGRGGLGRSLGRRLGRRLRRRLGRRLGRGLGRRRVGVSSGSGALHSSAMRPSRYSSQSLRFALSSLSVLRGSPESWSSASLTASRARSHSPASKASRASADERRRADRRPPAGSVRLLRSRSRRAPARPARPRGAGSGTTWGP